MMLCKRKNDGYIFLIALFCSLTVRTIVRIHTANTNVAETKLIEPQVATHAAGRSILHVFQYGPPRNGSATQFNMICVSLFLHIRMKHPKLLKNTTCITGGPVTGKMAEVTFHKNVPQAFKSEIQQLEPTHFDKSTVIFTTDLTKAGADQKKKTLRNQGFSVGIVQDMETLAEIGISGMVKKYAEFFSLKPAHIDLMTTYFELWDTLRKCCGMNQSPYFRRGLLSTSDNAKDMKPVVFCGTLDIDSLEEQFTNSELYKLLNDYEFMKQINRLSVVDGDMNGSYCSKYINVVQKRGSTNNGDDQYVGLNNMNVKIKHNSKERRTDSFQTLSTTAEKHGLLRPSKSSSQEQPFSPWVQHYISFHQSSIVGGNLRENARYIIYECKELCGGAGDRLIGMIKMFYLAMCTRRVLLIDAPFPIPLTDVFIPAHIEWNATFPQTLDSFEDMDYSIELGLREGLRGYRVPRTNAIPRKKSLDELLESSLMADYLETGHWREMAGKISVAAAAREAFRAMFQFRRDVMSRAEELKAAAAISGPYVAMHVRKGDSKMGIRKKTLKRQTDDNELLRCYRKLKASHPDAFEVAYLASDDVLTKERIANKDSSIHFAPLRPFHIDLSARKSHAVDPATVYSGVIDTWAEMIVMAESTCLILSKSMFTFSSLHMRDPQACAVSLHFCNDTNHRKGDMQYFWENIYEREFVPKTGKNFSRILQPIT